MLDPFARNGLTADAVAALADLVVTAVRRADLGDLPGNVFAPDLEIPLDQLDLTRRSHNALVWAGFVSNGELAPMSVAALARGRNIGAITLLDVLTEIERAEADSPKRRRTAGPARDPAFAVPGRASSCAASVDATVGTKCSSRRSPPRCRSPSDPFDSGKNPRRGWRTAARRAGRSHRGSSSGAAHP